MSIMTKPDLRATVLGSAVVIIASTSVLFAQSAPGSPIPNFIDARPLPQTDRSRADELEAKRKAEDELKRLTAEADAKRRLEEDSKKVAAEADGRRAASEADARKVAAESDAKARAEDAAKRLASEADARRKVDDDAKRAAAEAEAKRVATAAEAGRLAAETDAKRAAADVEQRRAAAEADAKRVAAEAEARRVAEAEAKRIAAEVEAKRVAAAAEAKQKAEDAARAAAAETEAKRLVAAAEAKQKADDAARVAAATAAATAARNPAEQLEVARLVIRGRQLISEGDFVSARLILDRAAKAGSGDAALALADTFDAAALARSGAVGVAADAGLANYWRARASQLGVASATPQPEARPAPAAAPAAIAATTPPAAPTPTVVAPASAPAAAATPAPPATSPDALRLVTRGKQMLNNGDIDGARLFFERALNAGAAEGALELGITFDPIGLRELGAIGLQPNPTRAAALYKQAQQMGAPAAAERLRRLEGR